MPPRAAAGARCAAPITAILVTAMLVTGCGGGGGSGRHAPDLADFLRLPIATPTSCAGKQAGATAGRRSPWVGTVDVSVFLDIAATAAQIRDVGAKLRAMPHAKTVYFESADEAYAEFQRLYTCSADVPRTAVPASYRLVLDRTTREQRDSLVTAARRLDGVASVSCDPSSPCLPKA
jgi:hypothetical protein